MIVAETNNISQRSFKTARSIVALILREMSTTYGRSPGGYIWAILEPVAGIAFLSIIFSLAIRSPGLGTNFPLFYATGMLPFLVYRDISIKTAVSIRFSRQLLFYPAVTYMDSIIARFFITLLTHILIFYIIITGITLIFDTQTIMYYPSIILSLFMAAILGLGIGCLNCFLFSKFPIWERLWAVLNRPMFILSCVLIPFEAIPWQYRDYLWYNPLVHVVGMMRNGFYPSYDAVYVMPIYVFLIALVSMVFGLILLLRYHRDILNY